MKDALLAAFTRVDDNALRTALTKLVEVTKNCTDEDLKVLYDAGRLPEGCMQFLIGVRSGK